MFIRIWRPKPSTQIQEGQKMLACGGHNLMLLPNSSQLCIAILLLHFRIQPCCSLNILQLSNIHLFRASRLAFSYIIELAMLFLNLIYKYFWQFSSWVKVSCHCVWPWKKEDRHLDPWLLIIIIHTTLLVIFFKFNYANYKSLC